MKKYIKTFVVVALAVAVSTLFAVALCGCENDEDAEKISYENLSVGSYAVTVEDNGEYTVYAPQTQAEAEVVFLFYLGTAMKPENYDHILRAIASSGIAVSVPNNAFADIMYSETETAFAEYPDAKYFIGGHSQGGGAALRRAAENPGLTLGTVFYSPMIINDKTLADTDIPAIYFEAENDRVLNDEYKAQASGKMNSACEYVFLSGANHMSYGEASFEPIDGANERELSEIQNEVISKTLAFMQRVLNG